MKTATMKPATISIEDVQAEQASAELGKLIAKYGSASITGLILRQAQQELNSLVRNAAEDAKTARTVGSFRIPSAA